MNISMLLQSTTSLYGNTSKCLVNSTMMQTTAQFWPILRPKSNEILLGLGRMFYVTSPGVSSFRWPHQVPEYFISAWPYFMLFMLIENFILFVKKKPTFRLNDSLTSLSHGVLYQCGRILVRSFEGGLYIWVYERYRLLDLPWNDPITWYLAVLAVDFGYYWMHRACHEIHILWAQHQVHHSSEEFNMTVGLRQGVLQGWFSFIFYLPLSLAIPPSHFLVHQQFNLLYQFWIHTQVVKNLGPLEYILNTPQHHRVHHGCNIYCLDKNYGGVLIIWDRLFGTFAQEKVDEKIIYGIIFNEPSFNPMHLQWFYTSFAFKKFTAMPTWALKLKALFYGPSWNPGKPRLGLEAEKFKVEIREKYHVKLPFWLNLYIMVHFVVILLAFHVFATRYMILGATTSFLTLVYIIGSVTSIGMLLENVPIAALIELGRCVIIIAFTEHSNWNIITNGVLVTLSRHFFATSAFIWLMQILRLFKISQQKLTNR